MRKFKKLIALLMAMIMAVGCFSAAASASYSAYLDSAIINQYNTIDKAELTTVQKSSLLLDMLDTMLEKEDILIDIPLIGSIDLRSTDNALSSIYSITGNWLYGSLTVGDLVILETHRDKIASVRRTTADKTDLDVINSLVDYVAAVAPRLTNILDGTFSWGMVKGFLPPEFRLIIDDFSGYIKELIWEELHPVNTEQMPANTTLDTLVQFMYDNQLGAVPGGERATAMGFSGVLPGFNANLETDNGYRTIEEAIFCALNKYVVPLVNNELKTVIKNAVESNTGKGGSLNTLVNVDYTVSEYNFDDNKSLTEQLNDVLGTVVNQMLLPGQTHFAWDFEAETNQTQPELLEDNIERLLRVIIPLGGDTTDVSSLEFPGLCNYIAKAAVEEFVKHMSIPANTPTYKIAYIGLRELCASIMPDMSYPETVTPDTREAYRNAIIEIGADIGTFYLNHNLGLNCEMSTTSGEFLVAFADWCMQYIDGLFDDTVYSEAADGWEKIDAIIWEFIPKNWLPYEAIADDGTEENLTLISIVYFILDTVFDAKIENIYAFFEQNRATTGNTSELYTLTARQSVINLIRRIFNGAFYTVDESGNHIPCIAESYTIDEFEDVLTNISILKDMVSNIFAAISARKDELVTTTINLVTMLMGAADEQSLGEARLDIDSQIYCENGAVPADQKIRIYNLSEGINRAWRNASGTLAQDLMYEIEIDSLVPSTNEITVAAIPANTKIAANSHYDVAISGTVSATKEVRFDLSYYILDENGNRLNSTKLVTSTFANFSTEGFDCGGQSAAIPETNKVSFDAFDAHLHTSNVYDVALFSILATNNGSLIGNNVRDIRRAVVTGTLPTGISANDPESGPIVRIDEASLTVDAYGTVNPYVSNVDPDAPQPYGIYDVNIAFDICSKDSDTGTRTVTRAHEIVVYNDYELPKLLERVMNANRQEANYANATDEWAAYQNAVMAGFELLHGKPDHSKMFANLEQPDGSANAYSTAVDNINAAITALDAKVKATNETLLSELDAALTAQAGVEREDYKLFTFDRWNKWRKNARRLIDSQNVPEGTAIPAISDFELIYAKHMLNLMYGRLIKNTPVKTHLAEAIENAGSKVESLYAPDTWADYSAALSTANSVNADTSEDLLQSTVNSARVELMKAERNLRTKYLVPASGKDTVVDSRNMYIYGIEPDVNSIEGFVNLVDTNNLITVVPYSGTAIGTGSYVKIMGHVNDNGARVEVARYAVILYGDVNGDGAINESDSEVLNDYINGTAIHGLYEGGYLFTAADLDRNGVIDMNDYNKLEDHVSGIEFINQADPTL